MGILKKYLLTVKVAVLFALLPVVPQAQNGLVNAFKESYALESKSNFKGAIEALKKAYQPDSYELNLRLGWLCYQAGSLNESVSYYSKAVALKPYAIEPKFGLAYPYSALGRWDDIIGLYNKILEVDPQNSIANYRLGLIYYNQGNYGRADPYIEKVVNLYPFDYDSLLLFAWNKLKLQKTREAKVLFQKVLLYSPDDPSALEGLGLIK
jgi:tetratricopeptide (TPR) repeat protein